MITFLLGIVWPTTDIGSYAASPEIALVQIDMVFYYHVVWPKCSSHTMSMSGLPVTAISKRGVVSTPSPSLGFLAFDVS